MAKANGDDGGGAGPILPRDILRRTDLFPADKLVYAYVADKHRLFLASGGSFRQAADTIGEALGIDERTARRSIRRLESAGLVAVNSRPGCPAVVVPTPDRKSEVTGLNPGQDARPTPDRMPDPPGQEVRGTPDRMPDEGTRERNWRKEPEGRNSGTPSAVFHVDEEASRIRRCWARAFEATTGKPCVLRPGDVAAIESAASLGSCREWPTDEVLTAELARTLAGMAKRSLPMKARVAIDHLNESWEDRPKRTNGHDAFPEPAYQDFTNNSHSLLEPPNART